MGILDRNPQPLLGVKIWFQSFNRRFMKGTPFLNFPAMKVQPASRDEKIKTAIKEASKIWRWIH
jgi:hypothetical protein